MIVSFHRTTSWLFDGVSSIVRGITQLAATPFTWFVKMPLRGLITGIVGKRRIEESEGFQKLVEEGKSAIAEGAVITLDAVRHELHRKYEKAIKRGQKTDIPYAEEEQLFSRQHFKYGKHYEYPLSAERASAASQYIGLFSTNDAEQPNTPTSKPDKPSELTA